MATTIDFTIRKIEALKAPVAGRDEYRDLSTSGLYLRVTPNGTKTFSYVGRAKGSSRVERATIGKYPGVKPEEARRQAKLIAGQSAAGESVAGSARAKRQEMTMADLFKRYHEHAKAHARRPENMERAWRLYVEPDFGTRKLSEVKPDEVGRWHRTIPTEIVRKREAARTRRQAESKAKATASTQRPQRAVDGKRSANQALALMHAMYRWASKRRLHTGDNPAHGIEPFPERYRKRFLQPDEMKPFFAALANEPNTTMRDFFQIALLTGARRSNVLAMRWQDVHLERAEWVIPMTKNGQPQTVTLAPEAVTILSGRDKVRRAEVERALKESPDERREPRKRAQFVFPSDRTDHHIVEPKSAWRRLLQRAELSDVRIHDLRRTLGSWQARSGASLQIIGKSLNHLSADATRIYSQLDLDPVRQSVDRAAASMLEAAGLNQSAEVAPIRVRA